MLPECREHDQRVKPEVGSFANQFVAVAAERSILGCKNSLDRLFANLFKNLVQALVIQAGDLGAVGRRALARLQHFSQTAQGVSHALLRHALTPHIDPSFLCAVLYMQSGSFSTGSTVCQ